jgi:hypothetical protein
MASVIHVNCDQCEGKFIVKIPNGFDDDYQVNCCPGCGAPVEVDDDLDGEE